DDTMSVTAVRLFLARFREEAGTPRDAIEKLLLDQLIVAHMQVGRLYALAAATDRPEVAASYLNTASRLVASVCQLVATLAGYRKAVSPRRRRRATHEGTASPKSPRRPGGASAPSDPQKSNTRLGSKGRGTRR